MFTYIHTYIPVNRNNSDIHCSKDDCDLKDSIREYVGRLIASTCGLDEFGMCFTKPTSFNCMVSLADCDNFPPMGQYLITGISYSKK